MTFFYRINVMPLALLLCIASQAVFAAVGADDDIKCRAAFTREMGNPVEYGRRLAEDVESTQTLKNPAQDSLSFYKLCLSILNGLPPEAVSIMLPIQQNSDYTTPAHESIEAWAVYSISKDWKGAPYISITTLGEKIRHNLTMTTIGFHKYAADIRVRQLEAQRKLQEYNENPQKKWEDLYQQSKNAFR